MKIFNSGCFDVEHHCWFDPSSSFCEYRSMSPSAEECKPRGLRQNWSLPAVGPAAQYPGQGGSNDRTRPQSSTTKETCLPCTKNTINHNTSILRYQTINKILKEQYVLLSTGFGPLQGSTKRISSLSLECLSCDLNYSEKSGVKNPFLVERLVQKTATVVKYGNSDHAASLTKYGTM